MPILRQTLVADTISALAFAILCLDFTGEIAALTGLPASIVAIAGWICVPSALLFGFAAARPSRAIVTLIVVGNLGWVLASIAVWIAQFEGLTPLGHAVVIGQAIAVDALLMLEWRGLKAMGRVPAAA
jgi:hypothetical protein